MNVQSFLSTLALSACLSAPAAASVVEGTVTNNNSFLGYMGTMTDISVVSGNDSLPSTAFAFCIDGSAHWPGEGTRQYTLADSFAPFMSEPAAVGKVTALLHYVVDYYFAPLMEGAYGPYAGYGFNQAVWQLTRSDGTQDSVRAAENDESDDPNGNYVLYSTIMDDLYAHFDDIGPDYRSRRYTIRFLEEGDRSYQSLAIVTENARNEVPEPSTLALFLAAGGIGFTARKARRKTNA